MDTYANERDDAHSHHDGCAWSHQASVPFNSINGNISGAIALTYGLSIGCVLWRRLFGQPLPSARWPLGRLGIAMNATGLFFDVFVFFISFFPLVSQPTA